jgi:flagellar hook-length control protein FliK
LRQLLQMLAPHAGSSDAGASRASPAERIAQSQPSYAAPAELMRRAAELATTPTAANGAQSPELLAAQVQPSSVTTDATITPTPANLAAPAQQTQSAPAGAQPVLQAPVGTPRWADELGSRLVLMSMRGQHEGSLSLTPEHLGPLEVRVSVSQNTANVWFGSQHADTRAALAEAMPRLRELMAGAGLTLGETGVSQHAPRQGSREGEPARISGARAGDVIEGLESASRPVARRIALGLVDTYA